MGHVYFSSMIALHMLKDLNIVPGTKLWWPRLNLTLPVVLCSFKKTNKPKSVHGIQVPQAAATQSFLSTAGNDEPSCLQHIP